MWARILRCPNYSCFSRDKQIKTWRKPKLGKFEDFNLSIGELIYCLSYCFLNKLTFEQVKNEANISSKTYMKIKTRLRFLFGQYFENQPKLKNCFFIIRLTVS